MTKKSFKPHKYFGNKYFLVIVLILGLLPVGAWAYIPVSGPMVIENPGEYRLMENITDYNGDQWQNGIQFYQPCIEILASDVIFDGNGHSISTGTKFNQSRIDQTCIYVDAQLERVSVINTDINGFNNGIYYYLVNPSVQDDSGGRIDNNQVSYNDYGITLLDSNFVRVINNGASNNKKIGIRVVSGYNNTVNKNIANNNLHGGIFTIQSENNLVTDNKANNNVDYGIYLISPYQNTVSWNDANNNLNTSAEEGSILEGSGIILEGGDQNHLFNNTANTNHRDGIEVSPPTSGIMGENWVVNNTANQNGHTVSGTANAGDGIFVQSDNGKTHINNNVVNENFNSGIHLLLSKDSNLNENHAEKNIVHGIWLDGTKTSNLLANEILGNKYGIELSTKLNGISLVSSDRNTVTQNRVHENTESGVYLNGTDNFLPIVYNTIVGNDIYNNPKRGIDLKNSNYNIFNGNLIHENKLGIKIDSSMYNNIYNNVFNNTDNFVFGSQINPNTWSVLLEPGTNIVGGPYKGGNFWGQPNGQGFSQDNPEGNTPGICDKQYSLTGVDNIDIYPLTNYLKVSFTADKTSGDAPLTVTFAGTVTGQTGNQWLWNFGDNTTGTTQNPTHVYQNNGVYTVSLTASNGGWSNTTTKTGYIMVGIAAPVADFSGTPVTGAFPLTVTYTDLSTPNSGQYAVTAWDWDFGDNTPHSIVKSPVHVYQAAGNYNVVLTVTNSGSSNTTSKVNYITSGSTPAPSAAFTMNPATGPFPLSVNFIDQSTGSPTLIYDWDFGEVNSTHSPLQNPNYIYSTEGTYHVNLTVSNAGGQSQVSHDVVVTNPAAPTAAFTMNPSSGPYPLTVNFIDQSAGTPTSWLWDFGDGYTDNVQNPTYKFETPDTYHVSLIVTNAGGSSAPVTHDVVVTNPAAPTAAFTMNPSSGPFPLTVNFIDQSTGTPTSWYWDLGDNITSNDQNPTYVYETEGIYTVSLVVTNAGGSSAPVTHDIVVGGLSEPTVAFTAIPPSGTVPLMVSFLDQSTANPDISTYTWSFGDGANSNQRNPVHQYTTSGSYNVTLIVTENGVAYPLTEEGFVVVNAPGTVTANFFAVPSNGGIEPLVVQFYDQSSGSPAPTSWNWDFDDQYAPASEKISTLQSPIHNYTKAGNYIPKLTVSNSQGPNTKVYPGVIFVRHIPPVANFGNSLPTTGNSPFSVTFTDQTLGQALTAWSWDFGDGGTSVTQSPVYTYNTPGNYSVTFKSYNNGGWSAPITKNNLINVIAAPPTPPANIIKLYPGWNFVSTAKKLATGSNTVEVVFANVDMDHHSPLLYDGQTKSWIQFISGTIKPLDGIWVYSKYQMDVTLTFDTTSIPVPPSKLVYSGWNSIGETGVNPISARELLTQVGQLNGNWDTLIGFNASSHDSETYIRGSTNPDYSDLKLTFPTKGYWLLMNTDDTLNGLV